MLERIKKIGRWIGLYPKENAPKIKDISATRALVAFSYRCLKLSTPFVAAAGLMQLNPDLASQNAEDYIADRDLPVSLSQDFNLQNIRVYERYSPLSSIHAAGRPFVFLKDADPIGKPFQTTLRVAVLPVAVMAGYFKEASRYVLPHTSVDAAAIDISEQCYVRPPGDVNLADFISKIGRFHAPGNPYDSILQDDHVFSFQSEQTDIERAIEVFILAHEFQHCSKTPRGRRLYSAVNEGESDADRAGLRAIDNSDLPSLAKYEARQIITAARMAGSIGDGRSHDTGMNNLKRDFSHLDAHKSSAAYFAVKDLTDGIIRNNYFPHNMATQERRFHAVRAIQREWLLLDNLPASRYAELFERSIRYLNEKSGGALISNMEYSDRVSLRYLSQTPTLTSPFELSLESPKTPLPQPTH